MGTTRCVAHYVGSLNYAVADSNPVPFTVAPATPAVDVTDTGGSTPAPPSRPRATVTGVGTDGTLAGSPNAALTFTYYAGNGTTGVNLGDTAARNAGTYTVVVYYASSGNYAAAYSSPVTFNIIPTASLDIPTTVGHPGDTVEVPVNLSASDTMDAADLAISYDPNQLEVIRCTAWVVTG